jgi:hypothetical protein
MSFLIKNKIGDVADTDGFVFEQVCSANVVDMGAGQGPTLIASFDTSGRRFCNFVFVVNIVGHAVHLSTIVTVDVDKVTTAEDKTFLPGRVLLALPMELSDYAGASCEARIPHLYALSDGVVKDVSKRYPAYYVSLLRTYKFSHVGPPDDLAACGLIESVAVEKLAGRPIELSPMGDQLRDSADPFLRMKAVALFKQVGDEAAIARLKAMTHDPSALVAQDASDALHELGKYGKP